MEKCNIKKEQLQQIKKKKTLHLFISLEHIYIVLK